MPKGQQPKPSFLKEIEGNRARLGRDRIKDDPAGLGHPRPPADFDGEELKLWIAVAEALPAGLLSQADDGILERYAVEWSTYREARRMIKRTGLLIQTPLGPARNPLLVVRNNAGRGMHLAGSEIGLSPVARARMMAPGADEEDAMSLLLGMADDDAPWASPSRTRN